MANTKTTAKKVPAAGSVPASAKKAPAAKKKAPVAKKKTVAAAKKKVVAKKKVSKATKAPVAKKAAAKKKAPVAKKAATKKTAAATTAATRKKGPAASTAKRQTKKSASPRRRPSPAAKPRSLKTLTIDIGGTGIKMVPLDDKGSAIIERVRELTPKPATPKSVIEVIKKMVALQSGYDRVSVGFPGVVVRGVVSTAPNLGTKAWRGFDLRAAIRELTGKPVRVINDADLQGYGVIEGRGVELALTLGTGLGSALYSDGHLVANLELGHHPYGKGKTYEDRVSNAARKKIGNKRFRARVKAMIKQLQPILNFDRLYLGGGNAKRLNPKRLAKNVKIFTNVEGMGGGIRLWSDVLASDD